MQRPPQKNGVPGAKRRREIRPPYGMPLGTPAPRTPALGALAGLAVIWAISGCFNPSYSNCHFTCDSDKNCPGNLKCVDNGTGRRLCAQAGTTTCAPNNTDAGADTGAMDTGGADGTDAIDGGDGPDGGDPGPPEELCHNGNCFPLPPAVRANLVLLLWPSNLPRVGSPVDVWRDQSGQGNHAGALHPTDAPPHVIPNGVHLDPNQVGSGFVVLNSPSLDFGSGDFTIIVVAGLASSTAPVTFFQKWDGARQNSRRISIDWVLSSAIAGRPQGALNDTPLLTDTDLPQPSVGAYSLRRAIDRVELRLNEALLGSATLPTPGLSTTNSNDVYLGVNGFGGRPADSLAAVIAIRSAIAPTDLNELQAFLRINFGSSP
jgi:hypothetical protein